MILLTNITQNATLSLTITGYQFPKSATDDWLLLQVATEHNNQCFHQIDPALEATDLLRLRDWLQALAQRKLPHSAQLSFTEPCLLLEFLSCNDHQVTIAIELACELKPDFPLYQFFPPTQEDNQEDNDWRTKPEEWKLVFALNTSQFSAIIATLEQWIERYPRRSHYK